MTSGLLRILAALSPVAAYAAVIVSPLHRQEGGYTWVKNPEFCPDPDRLPARFIIPDAKARWYEVLYGVEDAKCIPRENGFWVYHFPSDGQLKNHCKLDVGCTTIPDEYCIELIDGGHEKFSDGTQMVNPKWGIKVHAFSIGTYGGQTFLTFFVGSEDDFKENSRSPFEVRNGF